MTNWVEAARELCVVCMERPACMAFAPCGHECICDDAGCTTPFPAGSACPICRTQSTGVMKVFRAGAAP